MWCCPSWAPAVLDEEVDLSFWSAATDVCRDATVAVKASIIVARSAVVGSAMPEVTEATADGGDGGVLGADAKEDRLEPDTKLSRASVPKTAGPRLRSS